MEYQPVEVLENSYSRSGQIIGQGAYSRVYRGQELATQQFVAVKVIPASIDAYGVSPMLLREVSISKSLQHPNVLQLLKVVLETHRAVLILELGTEDLATRMRREPLTPATRRDLLRQLLKGTAVIHAHQFLHRDLKPENLILAEDGQLKVTDFGIARKRSVHGGPYTQEVQSLWYRAPEVLLGDCNYTRSVDLWSVGCIFAEMVTGRPLFPGENELDQCRRVFQHRVLPDEAGWSGVTRLPNYEAVKDVRCDRSLAELVQEASALDLLNKLLEVNPARRVSAEEALHHEYFREDLVY